MSSSDISSAHAEIDLDALLDVLSAQRRRLVIRELTHREKQLALSRLAERVATSEYDCQPGELTDRQHNRVYVSLYQAHVPALDRAGVCDYDDGTGMVSPTEETALAAAILDDVAARVGRGSA